MKIKSFYNIFSGIFFKIVILLVSLLTRNFLIKYVGNEANGIIALFTSVIGILCITELGVGQALSYSMYEPIINNDYDTISSLYQFFKASYYKIAIVIMLLGICFLPFIKILVNDYTLDYNIHCIFILQLTSVVLVYLFSAEVSLINAFKKNYITITFLSLSQIFKLLFQALILFFSSNLYLYLIISILSEIIYFTCIKIYSKKTFSKVVASNKIQLDPIRKKKIIVNIKAIFMHKIGGILVNSIDNIIISTFLGVTILGYYSNYILLVSALISICTTIFTQMISTIGQLYAKKNMESINRFFLKFYAFNYFIASIMFFCFYTASDSFINIVFSEGLNLDKSVVLVISINYFIQFMRKTVLTFRDSAGLYYYDRFKPIIEGCFNLILSLIFINLFGIIGVIMSTIITNIFICHIVEPYILFKHGFGRSVKKYYVLNFTLISLFIFILYFYHLHFNFETNLLIVEFIVNGFIGVLLSIPALLVSMIIFWRTMICKNRNFLN